MTPSSAILPPYSSFQTSDPLRPQENRATPIFSNLSPRFGARGLTIPEVAHNSYEMRGREVWRGRREDREPHAPEAAASPSKNPDTPPNAIVAAARERGVAFVLAADRALFTLAWRGPHDPLIDRAVRDNYETILAWLIREAKGEP